MALVGYARVSSIGQSLDVQRDHLLAAGCERIFEEKASGRSTKARPALADAVDWVREGDVFVVTRLDRLGRSLADLREIITVKLGAKKVAFRCLQQPDLNTRDATGGLLFNILGAFAEFETDLRKERQAEGIAKAKAKGVYRGRPLSIDTAAVALLKGQGKRPVEIARELKISRASVYRHFDAIEREGPGLIVEAG